MHTTRLFCFTVVLKKNPALYETIGQFESHAVFKVALEVEKETTRAPAINSGKYYEHGREKSQRNIVFCPISFSIAENEQSGVHANQTYFVVESGSRVPTTHTCRGRDGRVRESTSSPPWRHRRDKHGLPCGLPSQ